MALLFRRDDTGPWLKDLTFDGEDDDPIRCMWFIAHRDGSYSRCPNEKRDNYFCENHYNHHRVPEKRSRLKKTISQSLNNQKKQKQKNNFTRKNAHLLRKRR